MAENGREEALRIGARQREVVGMADAGRLDLDQHLSGPWALQLHSHDLERLAGGNGYGGADIHDLFPFSSTEILTFRAMQGRVMREKRAVPRRDQVPDRKSTRLNSSH